MNKDDKELFGILKKSQPDFFMMLIKPPNKCGNSQYKSLCMEIGKSSGLLGPKNIYVLQIDDCDYCIGVACTKKFENDYENFTDMCFGIKKKIKLELNSMIVTLRKQSQIREEQLVEVTHNGASYLVCKSVKSSMMSIIKFLHNTSIVHERPLDQSKSAVLMQKYNRQKQNSGKEFNLDGSYLEKLKFIKSKKIVIKAFIRL